MIELFLSHKLLLAQMGVLLMLSAFFSGSETAFFSIPHHKVKELLDRKGRVIELFKKLHSNPSKLLVTILLGNLTVNILFFSSSSIFVRTVGEEVGSMGEALAGISVLFMVILFGEIFPKAVGITYSKKIVLLSSYPLYFWEKAITPLRIILLKIAKSLEPKVDPNENNITADELKMLMDISEKEGHFSNQAGELIDDIVELSTIKARDVMISRLEYPASPISAKVRDVLSKGAEKYYNEIVIYSMTSENPIGVVDIRKIFLSDSKKQTIKSFIKPIEFVPETKKVGELFEEMLKMRLSIVAVVDEFGNYEGVITIDAIIEEIVGKVNENKTEKEFVVTISENEYRVLGELPLKDWDDFFVGEIIDDKERNVSTLGGFIINKLEKIPEVGDMYKYKNINFKVETVSNNIIKTLLITLDKESSDVID
jgi:CBS domain containing-hemolysin-like protein